MIEKNIKATLAAGFLLCTLCITGCIGGHATSITKIPCNKMEPVGLESLLGFSFDGYWQFSVSNPGDSALELALFLEGEELFRKDMFRLGPVRNSTVTLNVAIMDDNSQPGLLSSNSLNYRKKFFATAGKLGSFGEKFSLRQVSRNSTIYIWEELGHPLPRQRYELMSFGKKETNDLKRLFLVINVKQAKAQQSNPTPFGEDW